MVGRGSVPLLVGGIPFAGLGVASVDISRSVPDDCDMLRGRGLKVALSTLLAGLKAFGDSRRCGDLRADLRRKLLASGKVERLRQKESRGKAPLVVAADTGLTSGDGVTQAMIG